MMAAGQSTTTAIQYCPWMSTEMNLGVCNYTVLFKSSAGARWSLGEWQKPCVVDGCIDI